MTEFNVSLTVVQIVEADSPQQAERIARDAVTRAGSPLWWPSVMDELAGPTMEVD